MNKIQLASLSPGKVNPWKMTTSKSSFGQFVVWQSVAYMLIHSSLKKPGVLKEY